LPDVRFLNSQCRPPHLDREPFLPAHDTGRKETTAAADITLCVVLFHVRSPRTLEPPCVSRVELLRRFFRLVVLCPIDASRVDMLLLAARLAPLLCRLVTGQQRLVTLTRIPRMRRALPGRLLPLTGDVHMIAVDASSEANDTQQSRRGNDQNKTKFSRLVSHPHQTVSRVISCTRRVAFGVGPIAPQFPIGEHLFAAAEFESKI
jgi:hypothetical protein